jgi:cytochrome c oxidase assembly protein subunit 15
MTATPTDGRSRSVAIWLLAVAALVFAMVVVGGATRLTGSGLSITEWKPVTGAIPPLTDAAWQAEFARYQATPQYRWLNAGMSLSDFKFIYGWEWAHRLLGRLVGAAFALPFAAFLLLRRLPRRLVWRCAFLLALGALQGLVGWWMVKSGLEARVSVAPERLMVHLGLALFLLAALVWTALEAWFGPPAALRRDRWRLASAALAGLVFLQCLLGALVAGGQAGRVFNDWPLMNGRVLPEGYAVGDLWSTLAHSQGAVQFNHRLVAYAVWAFAMVAAIAALRAKLLAGLVRGLAIAVAIAATAQAALGIAALMAGVPIGLGMLHQAGAALLLGLATAFAWRARRT